ncbi:MAG: heme A synthase [Candidatus Margulisiibacteriota bacterium]
MISFFKHISRVTLIAVYVLILVGGIVRATGSGMGCPDWPKCYGRWMPPTSESQLPANYQAHYKALGIHDVTFNALKTWTEYINRLIGVVIGLLIITTFVASFGYVKTKPSVTALSFLGVALVVLQGWLGAKVVASNLHPMVVTLHMGLALVLVAVLITARQLALPPKPEAIDRLDFLRLLALISLVFTFGQLLLGTQVREAIDGIAKVMGESERSAWVSHLGNRFDLHRSFSWIIVLVNGLLAYHIRQQAVGTGRLVRLAKAILLVIGAELALGMSLAYLGFPAALQPLHLLLGTLLFGLVFTVVLTLIQLKKANT